MASVESLSTYSMYIVYVLGLVLAVTIGLCLVVVVLWTIYTYSIHRKYEHLPGPRLEHFFSGHAKTYLEEMKSRKITSGELFFHWSKEHGPIYRLIFFIVPAVVVLSPEGVKEVVVSPRHQKDPWVYKHLQKLYGAHFMGTGLSTELDHSMWALRRGFIDPAFHRKYLKESMTQYNDSADLVMKRLRGKADGVTKVTMLDELNKFALDVIAKVAFSLDLDIMTDELSPFTNAVKTTFHAMQYSVRNPFSKFNPLKAARDYRKKVREACQLLRSLATKSANKRLLAMNNGDDVPADVLSYIINATGGLTHEHYKMQNLVDDFVTLFIGGQETTANFLSSCLLQLGQFPEILFKLKTEVDSVMGGKTQVDFEDLPKLQYMSLVFKETLRMYSPAGGISRQTSEDIYLNGYRIPAKTSCMVSIYGIARMEEHFKNPLQFDPDRFISHKDHVIFSYLPFSLGPRSCIGKNFAMMESKVLLCKFLSSFEFTLNPDQSLRFVTHLTLHPEDGCRITLTPRE